MASSFHLAQRPAGHCNNHRTSTHIASTRLPSLTAGLAALRCLAAAPSSRQQQQQLWQPAADWQRRASADSQAAEESTPPAAAAEAAADSEYEDPEQQLAQLPRPSQRHQPQLTGKERAALRAQSEQLAKARTLQRVQVGAKGVTLNVLLSIMDAITKHEFVRVKLGEGCGLERKQTAEQLAALLDAAVVGQVGFTITLYRQKGLPRPDSLAK